MSTYSRHKDVQINFRMTKQGKALFEALRAYYGLSQAGLVEMLARDKAREVGLVIPGSGEETTLRKLRDSLRMGSRKPSRSPLAAPTIDNKGSTHSDPLVEPSNPLEDQWEAFLRNQGLEEED